MLSLFQYLAKGGYVMLPIGLCSIVALAVVIERFISLRHDRFLPRELAEEILNGLHRGQVAEVMTLCYGNDDAVARVVKAGLDQMEEDREEIRDVMQAVGKREASNLEQHLGILATIASISPLLGLLGTVAGMIRVFNVITVEGVGNAQALSGGISEALITTLAGLTVAIPTLVAHNYFARRVDAMTLELEVFSQDVLNLLARQGRARRP
jgi:biopolymer transport protein ExbB